MNKRILAVVYALALVAVLLISLLALPLLLVWALRLAVVAAAGLGVYLAWRSRDEYRYTEAKRRERRYKKK